MASVLIVGGLTVTTLTLNQGLPAHISDFCKICLNIKFLFDNLMNDFYYVNSQTQCTAFRFFRSLGWLDSWGDGPCESKWEAILLQATFVWPLVTFWSTTLVLAILKTKILYERNSFVICNSGRM